MKWRQRTMGRQTSCRGGRGGIPTSWKIKAQWVLEGHWQPSKAKRETGQSELPALHTNTSYLLLHQDDAHLLCKHSSLFLICLADRITQTLTAETAGSFGGAIQGSRISLKGSASRVPLRTAAQKGIRDYTGYLQQCPKQEVLTRFQKSQLPLPTHSQITPYWLSHSKWGEAVKVECILRKKNHPSFTLRFNSPLSLSERSPFSSRSHSCISCLKFLCL